MIRTAFVSSYPPCRSPLAMFTRNLAAVIGGREIVALYGPDEPRPSPLEVHYRIRRDEPEDYLIAARSLHDRADIVAIQHDFTTWGGRDGSSVLDFVDALDVPAVATLHAVPASPGRRQRLILAELARSTVASVVMSRAAETVLTEVYGIDPQRIEVIPYGIPDLPLVDGAAVKPSVAMAGRDVLLSFGLLRPNKGCELVVSALPAIAAARPTTVYVILGLTHPDVAQRDGEAYRESLETLAAELGVSDRVVFIDRFVGRVELTRWLEAADVILTPYLDPTQSMAGTLAYAMAAGRAVVSTPFAHATELLADGRGVVLPTAEPDALAAAVIALLDDPETRSAIGRRAHEHSRPMTWWHVAAQYRALFNRSVASPARTRASGSAISLHA